MFLFLQIINLTYLKIEMLLTIAATATIATAIIVIVSIKQSPFFLYILKKSILKKWRRASHEDLTPK